MGCVPPTLTKGQLHSFAGYVYVYVCFFVIERLRVKLYVSVWQAVFETTYNYQLETRQKKSREYMTVCLCNVPIRLADIFARMTEC